MSRSYRKPWVVDNSQYMKNQANRRIRRAKDVPNGGAYRKFVEQWDICDYRYPVDVKNDPFYKQEFWKYTRK